MITIITKRMTPIVMSTAGRLNLEGSKGDVEEWERANCLPPQETQKELLPLPPLCSFLSSAIRLAVQLPKKEGSRMRKWKNRCGAERTHSGLAPS